MERYAARYSKRSWRLASPEGREHLARVSSRERGWLTLPEAKIDAILSVVGATAAYYSHPDCFDAWATGLILREDLGSTGIGGNCAIVHQFQGGVESVATTNGRADWWLFLVPAGTEYDALDEKPVHTLLGLVMDKTMFGLDAHGNRNGNWGSFECNGLGFFAKLLGRSLLGRSKIDAREFSRLSQIDAAHLLNREMGSYLQRLSAEGDVPSKTPS